MNRKVAVDLQIMNISALKNKGGVALSQSVSGDPDLGPYSISHAMLVLGRKPGHLGC